MNRPTLAQWLREQPFALTLSSGYFGFFAHCGVVTALAEAGLRPRRITGASAGALVGGFWAAGVEPDAMWTVLRGVRKTDFWDPAPGFGLLRGRKFRRLLTDHLPCTEIERCPTPFAASAFDLLARETRVLDAGPLDAAIHASCSLPLLFQPVWWQRRPLLDGGIADRPGLAGQATDQRVLYHHLASRSPWRRPRGAHTRLPQRPDLTTVVLGELPRSGPDRLHLGPQLRDLAWRRMRALLDRPHADCLTA